MSTATGTLTEIGQRQREKDSNISTGERRHTDRNGEWKVVRQVKGIKQHIGLGSIIGTVALIVAVGTPAVKQGQINGTQAQAIDNLAKTQKESDERSSRALSEAVQRIEAGIKEAVNLAQENRAEVRSMRETQERKIDAMQLKVDSTWNWMVELKNRIGMIEAETKQKK